MNRSVRAGRARYRWTFAATATLTLAVPAVCLPVNAVASTNVEGALDESYGLNGRSLDWAAYGTADPAPAAADVLPDGSVAVALIRGDHTVAAARYRVDGSLDSTFGGDGRTHWTSGEPQLRSVSAVAVQRDGSVLVGGSDLPTTNSEGEIVRYTSAGAVDTTFGTGGMVHLNLTGQDDSVGALHVLGNGDILVGGVESDGMFIAKLTSTGALVPTFGIGGSATAQANKSPTTVNDIAVDSLGRIVTAGAETSGGFSGFALTRWNPDGTPDSAFGGGSVAEAFLDIGSSTHNSANGVVVQPDGKIVVAGVISFGDADIAVVRYNDDGSRDPGFATGGVWTVNTSADESLNDLQLQRDGGIVAAGYTFVGGARRNDYVVTRLTSGGGLDPDFGTTSSGFSLVDVSSHTDRALAVGILRDGRIVAAGGSQDSFNFEFPSMLRMYGDLTAPAGPTFNAIPLFATGSSVPVKWGATDDNTGVKSYDVQRQTATSTSSGFSKWTTIRSATTTRQLAVKRNPGHITCFRVRARDYAGNVGNYSSAHCTTFPVDDRKLSVHGTWSNPTGSAFYLRTARRSTKSGSSLTYAAKFKQLGVIASTCPTCGRAKVYLGKTLLGSVDLHSATAHNRVLFIVKISPSKVLSGTVRIVQSSPGKPVTIDGLGVTLDASV